MLFPNLVKIINDTYCVVINLHLFVDHTQHHKRISRTSHKVLIIASTSLDMCTIELYDDNISKRSFFGNYSSKVEKSSSTCQMLWKSVNYYGIYGILYKKFRNKDNSTHFSWIIDILICILKNVLHMLIANSYLDHREPNRYHV